MLQSFHVEIKMTFLEEAVKYAQNKLDQKEPCTVIGLNGMGKRKAFQIMEESYKNADYFTVDANNFNSYIEKENYSKEINAFHFLNSNDCSKLVQTLERLRNEKGNDFVYVIFTKVKSVEEALLKRDKGLVRNIFFIKPISFEDTTTLFDTHQKLFHINLDNKSRNEIYKLSGGHIGLIKDLVSLKSENTNISKNNILDNLKIRSRIEKILNDLPQTILDEYYSNSLKPENRLILLNLGFINESNKIFSPLIELYISLSGKREIYISNLTETEKAVFQRLQEKKGQLVSREEIAKIMWGSAWNYKYSDWAITQIIKRIRHKLEVNSNNTEIHFYRGKGYFLKH